MVRNSTKLEFALGASAIITGLLFVFRVFGPTETEVVIWGGLAVFLGSVIVLLSIINYKLINFIKMVFAFFLVVIQIPAIILWFLFHGSAISDGTPQSNFVAHWTFALPHMMIALLSVLLIVNLYKINKFSSFSINDVDN